jgi:hypothetical protein
VPITPDNLPDDLTALKRIIAAMALDAATAQAEIARLKFQLARYRRAEFGRSSEKLARDADSGGSRPRIRSDLARHSDLISLGVPR